MTSASVLPSQEGYYDVPAGMLATVVTHLEMRDRPPQVTTAAPPATELINCPQLSAAEYRTIYRHVGLDWLWVSRLLKSDSDLEAIIHHDLVDVYQVVVDGRAEGLLELDYRVPGECEIAFFGLAAGHTGRGVGPWLMSRVIEIAWSKPIARLWVHTCTFDHPKALAFYQRQGFKPFKQQVELICDPRLDGTVPSEAAIHIPMISEPSR